MERTYAGLQRPDCEREPPDCSGCRSRDAMLDELQRDRDQYMAWYALADEERRVAQAEAERLRAEVKHWRDARASAIEAGDAMQAERDALRAEVEKLRRCRDELEEIGRAINDPRVHNTMSIAEWCRAAQSAHCKDCCCARSWDALGITQYTGRSIPEEIEALRAERDTMLLDTRDFVSWFNRHYQNPSYNLDHPWCVINARLDGYADTLAAIDAARGES